nr:structural protein [Tolivirales sp.]
MDPATIIAAASAARQALSVAKQVKNEFTRTFKPKPKQKMAQRKSGNQAINAPAARGYRSQPPSVGNDSIIVRNDECIGTYTSAASSFDAQTIHIQPGNSDLFTVLGPQALRYQLYRMMKCRVYTKAQSGTSTDGSVTIAPQYSEVNTAYANIQAVNNLDGAVTGSIWSPVSMVASPSAIHFNGNFKHVSQNPRSEDDAFDLVVAFSNASGKSVILYIEYEIMLFKKASPKGSFSIDGHTIVGLSSLSIPNTTFVEPTITVSTDVNPFGLVATSNRIVLPKGVWEIELNGFLDNATGAANYSVVDARCAESGTELAGQQESWAVWRLKMSAAQFSASAHANLMVGSLVYVSDGVVPFSVKYALVAGTGTVSINAVTIYKIKPIGSVN